MIHEHEKNMPLYEYQCQECGHRVELLVKNHSSSPGACPQCQAESLEKQVAAPRFQLKGTGWYETDFKDKKSPSVSEKTDKKSKSE